jgi:hypothetical protein
MTPMVVMPPVTVSRPPAVVRRINGGHIVGRDGQGAGRSRRGRRELRRRDSDAGTDERHQNEFAHVPSWTSTPLAMALSG